MSDNRNRKPAVTRRVVLGAAAAAAAAAASPAHAAEAARAGRLDQEAVDAAVAGIEEDLIALRRDLHAHPEAPGQEHRTAGRVAELLADAGLAVTAGVGGHGVVGVLKGAKRGRTVAYRADMDAVPGYGGEAPAHLCGHDVHTAVGVGVALVLAALRRKLSGTVVFVFQPAEETLEGARAMLEDGVLESTAPAEIHALHCGAMPVGEFGVNPGLGLPGLDRGTVALSGPEAAERAAALAEAVGGLSTVSYPESPADFERLVEDLVTRDGPLAEFVTASARAGEPGGDGTVTVDLSYRCWPEERYTEVRDAIGELSRQYGEAAVSFPADPFPALVCPVREGHELKRHLRCELDDAAVHVMRAAVPFNGEDFALFMDRLPGTYTYLGVGRPGADLLTYAPHSPFFDPDERAIGFGVRAMAGWLAERTRR